MELEIYFYWVVLKFFSMLTIRFKVFLNHIKVQSKERNSLIDSIDLNHIKVQSKERNPYICIYIYIYGLGSSYI